MMRPATGEHFASGQETSADRRTAWWAREAFRNPTNYRNSQLSGKLTGNSSASRSSKAIFLLKMTNNHSHLRGIFPLRQTGNFSVASGKHFLETGAFLTLEVLFREFTKLVGNGTKKP